MSQTYYDIVRSMTSDPQVLEAVARAEAEEVKESPIDLLQHRVAALFRERYQSEYQAFAHKLAEEAQELVEDPDNTVEAADVLICLLGYLDSRGLLFVELLDAANDKMTINESRRWARMENGAWKHV